MLFDIMEEEQISEVNVDKSSNQQLTKSIDTSIAKHPVQSIGKGINTINFFDSKQLAAAEAFLGKIMRSEKGGVKSINDGLAILMRAQDLQIPFSSCIEHIHVINGKTGVDIHIAKALLSRAGVRWRCLKDYAPQYEYTDGFNAYNDTLLPEYAVRCISQKEAESKANEDKDDDKVYVYPVKWYKDFNGNIYKDYQLNIKQFGISINRQQAAEITKSGRCPVYRIPPQPIDYVTEYEFERVIDGKLTTCISHFSYTDAVQAEMFEKDTYKKYPRILISHRAFTLGARDIASDVLFGCMETTELKIVSGQELNDSDIIEADIEEL